MTARRTEAVRRAAASTGRRRGSSGSRPGNRHWTERPGPAPRCTLATLTAATRRPRDPAAPGEERYACQATELLRAAPERIPPWDARQYLAGRPLGQFRCTRHDPHRRHRPVQRVPGLQPAASAPAAADQGRQTVPVHRGQPTRPPFETLDLQPGELVRVKSKEEIVSTLDTSTTPTAACRSMARCCGTAAGRPGCCGGSSRSSTRRPAGCCGSRPPASSWTT